MILANKLFAGIFRCLAKIVVDMRDLSAVIGNCNDRGFVKSELEVRKLLQKIAVGILAFGY